MDKNYLTDSIIPLEREKWQGTERLIIRDPMPTDIGDWHRLLSDPKTMYYLPDIMTRSLDESRQNLETAVAETQNLDRTKYFFAIEKGERTRLLAL